MTTMLEKPTPADLVNKIPALNQGDMLELEDPNEKQDDSLRPRLGEVATREDYRQSQGDMPNMSSLNKFDTTAKANKATLDDSGEDEKVQDEFVNGFTIHDATAENSDIDDLPDELKDELGDPDEEA